MIPQRSIVFASFLAGTALCSPAIAQQSGYISPEVHPDRKVSFRIRAPKAESVNLWGELGELENRIDRDESGLWTITVGPVDPEVYDYAFLVDGVYTPDVLNRNVKLASNLRSVLIVPNEPPELYERLQVPHGSVHVHQYFSKSLGTPRQLHIYTPPGYETSLSVHYPVLYLLHGSGDHDSVWLSTGRAGYIADNLIANNKAKSMIIVMPRGHAEFAMPQSGDENPPPRYLKAFETDLLKDVIPLVEKNYRVLSDAQHRAIAGLSMGGEQTLHVGLNHLDRFRWVCAFSASMDGLEFDGAFPQVAADSQKANDQLSLLWIGCGDRDWLMQVNSDFTFWLKVKGVEHTFVVTAHGHEWAAWRRYLSIVLPKLFQD